jgi:hypothetical protein
MKMSSTDSFPGKVAMIGIPPYDPRPFREYPLCIKLGKQLLMGDMT